MGTDFHDYIGLETSDTHMNLSNIVHNNLGGHGPDGGAAEMRYQNIFPLTGASVDLVVRAVSPYHPKNTDNNGLEGTIGAISFRGGMSTTFTFSFSDSYNHSKPVTIGQLYFSYFDIDGDKKGLKEEVSTPNYEKVYLSQDTSVRIIEGDGPGIENATPRRAVKKGSLGLKVAAFKVWVKDQHQCAQQLGPHVFGTTTRSPGLCLVLLEGTLIRHNPTSLQKIPSCDLLEVSRRSSDQQLWTKAERTTPTIHLL